MEPRVAGEHDDTAAGAATIVVIGAGVSGLATALRVQEAIPTARVVVVSDKQTPDTTSNRAGAIICPGYLGATPQDRIIDWVRPSRALARPTGVQRGAGFVRMGLLSRDPVGLWRSAGSLPGPARTPGCHQRK